MEAQGGLMLFYFQAALAKCTKPTLTPRSAWELFKQKHSGQAQYYEDRKLERLESWPRRPPKTIGMVEVVPEIQENLHFQQCAKEFKIRKEEYDAKMLWWRQYSGGYQAWEDAKKRLAERKTLLEHKPKRLKSA